MIDWVTLATSILATLSAGGWLTSRYIRKREEERHQAELERAKAENETIRQNNDLNYTKEILEIYSAHIVTPLQDQINIVNKRLDDYENAINTSRGCSLYPDCPVLHSLQRKTSDDLHG